MNTPIEPALLTKIQALSPQQREEVENFVEFLSAKARRVAALDRLLHIAPALARSGALPLSDEEVSKDVEAARQARRQRSSTPPDDAHRS